MKKILLTIPILALAVSSCMNDLDYRSGMDSEFIVLNASLRTDKTEHFVFLSQSKVDNILPLSGAQLRCYINGKLVAEGQEDKFYRDRNASRYTFAAAIRPGDEVRLEAGRGGLKASATAIAPSPAQLAGVDTTRVGESPYYYPDSNGDAALACKLRLQDIPDQPNWYRIFVSYDERVLDSEIEHRQECSIPFGFNWDPILGEGNLKPSKENLIQGLISLLSGVNSYCKFRDTAFADKTAEVEIHIRPQELEKFRYTYYRPDGELPRLEKNLHFDFLTISKEEYDYLVQYEKALNSDNVGLLQEPVHIPSNVEGGMGFFSVASVSSRAIRIKD